MIGEIDIKTLKVGNANLLDSGTASLVGFNIYEDILLPHGPYGEINLHDYNDTLSKANFSGKETVEVSFDRIDGKENPSFKFKLFQNKNLDDQSIQEKGSMHSKNYTLRFVSPELLHSQGNYVSESFNDLTTNIGKKILKNYFKTEHEIEVDSPSNGKRRMIFHNEHSTKCLYNLNSEHVSTKNPSSCYTVFKSRNGNKQVYKITEFEELMKQEPIIKLKQTTTLASGNATDEDKQNSIIWLKVSDSFQSVTRSMSKPNPVGYDATTGKVFNQPPKESPKFTVLGKTVYDKQPNTKGVVIQNQLDSANDQTKNFGPDSKKNRLDFLSHLSQNSAELEVIGNPLIKPGSVIELDIPKKAMSDNESGESQFNGKVLVTTIRHKIKPPGQQPRYTMIIRVVKAAFNRNGGGDA